MEEDNKTTPHPVDGMMMKAVMGALKETFDPKVGIILLTFNTGEEKGGMANYASTANREDCIRFLRETANRLEKNRDFQTPNNN